MEERNETFLPPGQSGNPVTLRKHRQEVFWQISLPLLIGVLVVLVAGAGVIYAGASSLGEVNRWASISIIWLVIPALVLTLLFTILLAALAYGLSRLARALPGYTRRLQDIFILMDARVRAAANAAAEPVLRTHSFFAGLRALRRK